MQYTENFLNTICGKEIKYTTFIEIGCDKSLHLLNDSAQTVIT